MKFLLFFCPIFFLTSCSIFHTPSERFVAPTVTKYSGPYQVEHIATTLHHEINTNSPLALIDNAKVYYQDKKFESKGLESGIYNELYSILCKDQNLLITNKITHPFWTIALDFTRSGTSLNTTLHFTSPAGEKSTINRSFEINN